MRSYFLISLLAFGIQGQAFAGNVDPGKFCIKDYCLGETLAKLGGAKAGKELSGSYGSRWKDLELPMPTCSDHSVTAFFNDEDPASKSYVEVTLTADPTYRGGNVEEYYKVSTIKAHYPMISNDQINEIKGKVVKRAGAGAGKAGMAGTLVWPVTSRSNIVLNAGAIDTMLYYKPMIPDDVFLKQQGCSVKTPAL